MHFVQPAIQLGEVRPITVNTLATGKPDAPCSVIAKGPNTPFEALPTKGNVEGYICSFTPKEVGPSHVKVVFAEQEVPNSPFSVNVESGVDVTKVQVNGLERRKCIGNKSCIVICHVCATA